MKILSLSFLSLFLLTSCFPVREIADDIGMVTVIGFDEGEGDQLKATLVVPYYQSNTEVQNRTFTVESHFTKEAIDKGSSQSENPLVLGQVEVVTFNKSLAEKGLMEYIDAFQRDPSVSTRLHLALAENSSQELLDPPPALSNDLGVRLDRMIQQNIRKNLLPESNLHVFLYAYYQKGLDPFLPIIKKENDHYKIDGIAFFDGDLYKGEIEYAYDTLIFRMLKENLSYSSMTFEVKDGVYASVQNITTDRKVLVDKPNSSKPTVIFDIEIEAFLREYTGSKAEKQDKESIKRELKKVIEEKADSLFAQFKEWEVDPLGIENEIKMRTGKYLPKGESIYDHAEIKVKVKVNLVENGVSS